MHDFRRTDRPVRAMPIPSQETVCRAATDAFVEAIRREEDPWRQARLLAFVRKRREHEKLRKLAEELVHQPETYWGALEILTDPTPRPPKDGPLWIEPVSDVCMVRIPPGRFLMGAEDGEYDEAPVHEVEITKEFWLGRHPLTNVEYRRYVAEWPAAEPSEWGNRQFNVSAQPVVGLSWIDAEAGYCEWLRKMTRYPFHLPTEAEWEFASRFKNAPPFALQQIGRDCTMRFWEGGSLDSGTPHTVGITVPNTLGLCDTLGNVFEWCWDLHGEYDSGHAVDPIGRSEIRSYRVGRGGSWASAPGECRSTLREPFMIEYGAPFIGFRLAMSQTEREELASIVSLE